MTNNNEGKDACPTVKVKLKNDSSDKWSLSTIVAYSTISALLLMYCIFLYDRKSFSSNLQNYPVVTHLDTFFNAIEKYSPFHEFLMDDDELISKYETKTTTSAPVIKNSENVATESAKLMTPSQLKTYDGSEGSPGLYIGLLGHVFDVSKGKDHYGPGGGYSFFSAKDGSRAFVTGEFTEEGLTDDLTGLDSESYLVSWLYLSERSAIFLGHIYTTKHMHLLYLSF